MKTKEQPFAQIRRAKGWSRRRAADEIRISAGYLGQLERGQAFLTLAMAERMCAAYGVGLNELIRMPD